ncbi:MAG: membrane protein insertase YidC [Ferruginibacter sp.]|nr:membrane protein insertase YidC [Ferruginibacter sp.]
MGMDRNTVIGFVLIGLLLMGMFYFNNKGNSAFLAEQKRVEDSIARTRPKVDLAKVRLDSLAHDSSRRVKSAGSLQTASAEQFTTLENEVMKITFTNKGGQPKIVELKNYKTLDGKPVIIQKGDYNKIEYKINTGANETGYTSDLNFVTIPKTDNADKSQTLSYILKDSAGKQITHQYTLHPDDYLIDFAIVLDGADKLVNQNAINVEWKTETSQVEKDEAYEKLQSHICYLSDGGYDFSNLGNGDNKKFEKPVEWLAVKQQFFISSLISKTKFQNAEIKWAVPADTALHIIAQTVANGRIDLPQGSSTASVPLQLYYGPSDYHVLKAYNNQMENIVPYGSGIFAFVKYINRHVLLPVFDLLRKNVASMGIVILLLTLFIRLLTSPILYKSYVSGAKMKALKPEIDKLKEKHGEDKQAFSMDQMKLWKTAGVSPLGGCLPAVLQIPIFMSLYYFFQSNISLRGQNFLWAKDLAAYDSIYNLPFTIPFYGDHVSLFTLTAVLTSLLISIYSMTNMQDNSNPVMKYMPYIFPVLLLGVFNKLPSALTWYYTISNTITLLLQIVIQKYIIDHDKILAQIEENRKKPVKQSKLQERIQAMQDTNKKVQDMKAKTQKK